MNNIVILVSGSGTNLERILQAIKEGEIKNAVVKLVVADRECFALTRADNHGIENKLLSDRRKFSSELIKILPKDTDLIILAGFLSILEADFCRAFSGKIINIHPSLLPKYGGKGMWGMHVHNAVIAAKERESGATVHFVTPGIDEGEIILQEKCNIDQSDTPESLAEKIHQVEYRIFPKAINKVLENL